MAVMINYVCGVCDASRKIPGNDLPPGWRIPSKQSTDRNLASWPPDRHMVVAICSDRCESEHNETQRARAVRP